MLQEESSELEAKDGSAPSEQSLFGEGDISPQNQEALLQIASMIRLAESFRLGFVKCNQPVQCLQMVERLKEMLAAEADVITVNLKEPVSSLRRSVLQALDSVTPNVQRKAIMVLGFERSIPSEGPATALDELNQSRDNFPKSFSGPLLIWLPDYALTRLAREAPDFWGWRSGVFEFSPEQKMIDLLEKTMVQGAEEDRLSLAEKRELAYALGGLIRDYQEMDRGEREDRALVSVINRLGNIHILLGDYGEAQKLNQQSLHIFQQLGDKSGMSMSLHTLGVLALFTSDYDEARKLFQHSLDIAQEIDDKRSVSESLYNLGTLAYITGDYDEARKFCLQSLDIAQEIGDKRIISKSLGNLGNLAYITGDYDEARKFYRHSLDIAQGIGDKRSVSESLGKLGTLAQTTKDYDEARKFYRQSLDVAQEIGDKCSVSMPLHLLGNLAKNVGDYEEARKHYQQSLDIAQEMGDKPSASALLNQQGILAQDTGDYDEARRLYKQSMEISRQLGDKRGLASTLIQLSLLELKEGHLEIAQELVKEAEDLLLKIGSPLADQLRKAREDLNR